MKKTLLLALLLGGPSAPLFAQSTPPAQGAGASWPKGTGKISGTILEASTRKPVPFASIALLNPGTGKPVDGTSADENGQFSLRGLGPGTYSVSISFLGYKTLEKTNVVLTDKSSDVQLGTLALAPEATQLKEVTVTGQRALIEERVDRTVYNAENDQTTRGGDATDVLKRVPMLSVDLDGNVSLRGSSNIRVLINNKPSTIAANSVADALKQIPADQIKSVEVITSPSAKYDAEGSGGIINIITKKNALQGATLNVDASAGTRGSNLGLNGSYRKGKMGFSLGGFGRAGYNIVGSYRNTQQTNRLLTLQQADSRTQMLMGRYTLGWDYDINEHNSLNASVQYGLFNLENYQDRLLTQTLEDNTLASSSLRNTNLADLSGTVDLSLNYTHTTAVPQREFSVLTLYSRNNRNNDFRNDILSADELISSRLKNENTSSNQEMTIQADYQTPIGDKQLLEVGGKNILRQVNSRYAYFTATGSDGAYLPAANSSLSNAFDYTQNVTAGYVSYTLNFLKNYSLKAGTRYEYTTIKASFLADETVDIPSYGVLVPSVNFSRKLANGNMVKVAYNRRIQRPSLQFLNPNVQAANPYSITQGNATLQPEYTNNYELSYSTFWKGTMLNLSSFVRTTNGSIQPVRSSIQQDTVVYTTYANIGRENAYGLSLFTSVNLSNKLTLSGGTDAYYAVLTNNVADPLYSAKNEGWVVNGRVFGNYSLKNNWGLQAFAFYRGNQVQLQGFQSGFGIYSLSVKKDFDDKRGSFGLGAENFFSPTMRMRTEVNSPLVNQSSTNTLHNMSFKLNFSYRIGKLSGNTQPKRRKTVTNDDLKDSGDNSGGSMAGGGAAPVTSGPAARPATNPTPGAKPTGMLGTQPGAPALMPAAPTTTPTDSTQRSAENFEASGRWSGQLGDQGIVLELQQAAYTLTGTFSTPTSKMPLLAGTVTGSTLTFSLTTNGNTVVYEGQAQGDQLILTAKSGSQVLHGTLNRQK